MEVERRRASHAITLSRVLLLSRSFLSAPKMQSALLARSGASSFVAQRRVVRPRAVAARAQIKAPQVSSAPYSRERIPKGLRFGLAFFVKRRRTSSFSLFRFHMLLHCSFPASELLFRDAIYSRMRRERSKMCQKVLDSRLEPAISRRRQRLSCTHASLCPFSLSLSSNTSLRQNVTQPPVEPKLITAKYGFVDNAERLNSRAAMVSFFHFRRRSFTFFFSLSLPWLTTSTSSTILFLKTDLTTDGLLRHPARRARGRQGHIRDRRDQRRERPRVLLLEERIWIFLDFEFERGRPRETLTPVF